MRIVLRGELGKTISGITEKISVNYGLPDNVLDAVLQFEYARKLPFDNTELRNETKIDAITMLTKQLEQYIVRGKGKPLGRNLDYDANVKPEEQFHCDYYMIFKNPITHELKKPVSDCLMVCSRSEGLSYYHVSDDESEAGIDILDSVCRCKKGKCSLPEYFNLPKIEEIEEEAFREILVSEINPGIDAIYAAIDREVIPVVLDAINRKEENKETHPPDMPYII